MNNLKYGLYRLRWILVIFAAAVTYIAASGSELLKSQIGVLSWKILLVTVAIGLADMTRRHIWPYLDLSYLLENEDGLEPHPHAGLIFLGVAIFYVGVIYSLTAGL